MKLKSLFTGAAVPEIDRRREPTLYPNNSRTSARLSLDASRSDADVLRLNHVNHGRVNHVRVNHSGVRKTKILKIAVMGALVAIPSGLMADKVKAKWDGEDSISFRLIALANIPTGFVRRISFSDELRNSESVALRERELRLTPALTLSQRDDRSSIAKKYHNKTAMRTVALSSDIRNKRYINKLRYVRHILAAANKTHVDPALIHAVIAVESNHNPLALSHKGALGLMQLMPQTAARYGVENRMDPVQNINGGAHYLADLLRMFEGDVELVLAAYNAGEHVVIRYGNRIPPYRETMAYVPRVLGYYETYKSTLWAMHSNPGESALAQTSLPDVDSAGVTQKTTAEL